MRCPQCGFENPDEVWNCTACGMNLYWAIRHYDKLSHLRMEEGLGDRVAPPPFLLRAHRSAMTERAARGGQPDNRVRIAARKVLLSAKAALTPRP